MKEYVNVSDYASQIVSELPKGILVNTKAGDKFNSMVIGWGMVGVEWGKQIFITYVRTSRCTHDLLEENPEFTVSIPLDGHLSAEMMKVCGSQSGHDMDKAEVLGLTLVEGDEISVPGIKEVPLTLECKLLYKRDQDASLMPKDIADRMYTGWEDPATMDPNKTIHTAYYGEIVKAYIIK